MSLSFLHETLPSRVRFGSGTLALLPGEVDRLGLTRLLVMSTPEQRGQADQVAALLGDRVAGAFTGATMHTPVFVTDQAMALIAEHGIDGLVAVGGGSTTGLGKAIAWRTDLPQIVIPTTYAGSEMTSILGETADGVKTTRRDARILPELVIYDVDLTLGLTVPMSVTSGFNAMAHAVEALYAPDISPIIGLAASDAIAALARALPGITNRPRDVAARTDALYGAWLGGYCLGTVGMALHHKLCHTLGGSFDLPHADTHTILLPHVLAFNAPAAPQAAMTIAKALGVTDPARGLWDLAIRVTAPRSLRDIGMPSDGIALAADLAVANPYWNPRPVTRDAIADLLERAWHGLPPQA